MATSTATAFPVVTERTPVTAFAAARTSRRRSISPDAGHALLMLGHAIEYLAEDLMSQDLMGEDRLAGLDVARLQAVELLMDLNREVYMACPELPTLAERWRSLVELFRTSPRPKLHGSPSHSRR